MTEANNTTHARMLRKAHEAVLDALASGYRAECDRNMTMALVHVDNAVKDAQTPAERAYARAMRDAVCVTLDALQREFAHPRF